MRELARGAKAALAIGREHPVADVFAGIIDALPEKTAGIGSVQAAPYALAGRLERGDGALLGLVAEHAAAIFTANIFKENLLSALVAMECFHGYDQDEEIAVLAVFGVAPMQWPALPTASWHAR